MCHVQVLEVLSDAEGQHHVAPRRTAPEALILAKNDHKGRRDSRERELSRTVCFASLRGRTLEACAEMVG